MRYFEVIIQSLIKGYSNKNEGGILLYNKEDIQCKGLKLYTHIHGIEGIFVKVNLRKTKLLLFANYHPTSQIDENLFGKVEKSLRKYRQIYSKLLLLLLLLY